MLLNEAFEMTYRHRVHVLPLKQVYKNGMQQSRLHETVHCKISERQLTRQSRVTSVPWCDSTSDHEPTRSPHRDWNVSISLRNRVVLPERPAA